MCEPFYRVCEHRVSAAGLSRRRLRRSPNAIALLASGPTFTADGFGRTQESDARTSLPGIPRMNPKPEVDGSGLRGFLEEPAPFVRFRCGQPNQDLGRMKAIPNFA